MEGPIGITLGDPAGVGPEVLVKALARSAPDFQSEDFLIIGSEEPILHAAEILCTPIKYEKVSLPLLSTEGELPHIALVEPAQAQFPKHLSPGNPDASSGWLSFKYLELATTLAIEVSLAALVTLPLSKSIVAQEFPRFRGHTEYLQERTASSLVRMMLGREDFWIALVTTHRPLREVASHLTVAGVCDTIKITHDFLTGQLGKPPSIVVCALNPHAGDSGLLGSEENDIIAPACLEAKAHGCNCEGPYPADTALAMTAAGEYNAAVAMYHDQALIALKLHCPNRGANITLGLPFVRTSPLHGTGFDIAGKGIAREDSFIDALRLAIRLTRKQKG